MSKSNDLVKAAEVLELDSQLELGALIGGALALRGVAEHLSAKSIEMAKRIKDTRLYERTGLSWDGFCDKYLGARKTVERKIGELEEFGPDYLGLTQIVRVGQSVYSLMEVKDGAIVYNGERIAITKANEDRIKEVVGYYRAEAAKAKEELAESSRSLTKTKEERDNAKKAARRAAEEVRDLKSSLALPFANCSYAQTSLVRAQSRIVEAMALVQSARNEQDFAEDDEAWVAALAEFAFKQVAEVCGSDPTTQMVLKHLDPVTPMERAGVTVPGDVK